MKSRMSTDSQSGGSNSGLTPREVEVLILAGQGKSRKEVADDLKVSIDTVSTHLKNIYRKLKVGNLAGAIRKLEQLQDPPILPNVFC